MGAGGVLKIYSLRERPALEPDFERLADEGWPRFLRQRDELGSGRYWSSLFTDFADWQLLVCGELDRVVAVGHTVPFAWDGDPARLPGSIAGVLASAAETRAAGRAPTALCALAALVDRRHRGQGLSRVLLRAMAERAGGAGLGAFVAPVRPVLKAAYPLIPMEEYVRWTDGDGLPFDPWLRTHARLGAELLSVLPRAMVIAGPVARWEEWTGLALPGSGAHVVTGALQPVRVDRERDEARYEDPNVWMRHPAP
ncbi:MAG TPA: GNAT family N-acetyltransferase [Vicinamibacteria bacterium]|nr:GNAT family N-acetyltransferase [Vicinamibacteria bacterium]